MTERPGAVTFKGIPMTVVGEVVRVGQQAPSFTVAKSFTDYVSSSEILPGKITILSVVPSLDTGICDAQTRRFNEEAGRLGGEVQVVTLSVDLPVAQARWCGASGLKNVITYSDYRDLSFGTAYGCNIKEIRLLQRSVFVVDRDAVLRYVEYVPEIAQHPEYEKALTAAKELL